jgi:hypothetical protein
MDPTATCESDKVATVLPCSVGGTCSTKGKLMLIPADKRTV